MRSRARPPSAARLAPPAELVQGLLVVRAGQRLTIQAVCAHPWIAPTHAEPPIDMAGAAATPWEEDVAARLAAYGCPLALVQHHVNTGTTNHVTAAYECLLLAEDDAQGANGVGAAA